jgi:hypothetical protein
VSGKKYRSVFSGLRLVLPILRGGHMVDMMVLHQSQPEIDVEKIQYFVGWIGG